MCSGSSYHLLFSPFVLILPVLCTLVEDLGTSHHQVFETICRNHRWLERTGLGTQGPWFISGFLYHLVIGPCWDNWKRTIFTTNIKTYINNNLSYSGKICRKKNYEAVHEHSHLYWHGSIISALLHWFKEPFFSLIPPSPLTLSFPADMMESHVSQFPFVPICCRL